VPKKLLLGAVSPCNGQVAVEEVTSRYGGLLQTYIENKIANWAKNFVVELGQKSIG
jgi:hypothetical protein